MAMRLLPVCFGKSCPACSRRTDRLPFPAMLLPLKTFSRGHLTYRGCVSCGWKGFSLHREKSRRISRSASVAR